MAPAGIDDVDDALDANVEHEIRRAVEGGCAIDEGEVVHLRDATHGSIDRGGVTNVAFHKLDVVFHAAQPALGAARIVVEHAHRFSAAHQLLHQRRANEAAAARYENALPAHAFGSVAESGVSIQRPLASARVAASMSCCTR